MIRKCHNHTLQTNQQHREKEPHNTNSNRHLENNQINATSSLFPIKTIAKLEGQKVLNSKTKTKHNTALKQWDQH